ncbi:MAG: hypothetical protein AAFX58_14105, partial [Pseudomonadota bacterium]
MSALVFLLLSLVFTSVTLAIILFTAWRTLGRAPHALSWAVAFGFGALQWSGNLGMSLFPSKEAYWMTVNALALASATFGLRGHLQRTGREAALSPLAIPATLCFVTLGLVTF